MFLVSIFFQKIINNDEQAEEYEDIFNIFTFEEEYSNTKTWE